jgi:murein DD-endopeptidase MepM/ murein hydrolase activator NlpD
VAVPASPGRLSLRARKGLALSLVPLAGLPFLAVPLTPATATERATAPSSQTQEELRLEELEAAGDLEDSSAAVRAAAAALRAIEQQIPGARSDVARARGELAGARAKARAAEAAVRRAEARRQAAQARVDAAGERVEQGREDVGRLARRAYQRGRLSDLRDVVESGEPQDVVVRAGMLRAVFRSQNDSLTRLSADRLALAGTRAELAADERALEKARTRADEGAARAREVAVRAERAAARVESLASQRAATLRSAEKHRAEDLQDYQEAQAASRALAERIRAAAARAAAARAAAAKRAAAAAEAERKRREAAGQKPVAPRRSTTTSDERSGRMLWPAPGRLTSRYGYREHPIYGDRRFHAGIDIGGGLGARVSAADDGIVIYAGYASGYGTLVVVSHGTEGGRDLSTAYAHMGSITVGEGQAVGRGDKLGEIGNEGNSTGPHLHFEVRRDGEPVDPLDYVDPP